MARAELIQMIGKRFGYLKVITRGDNIGVQPAWICRCDCGAKHIVQGGHLRRGSVKSCGCMQHNYSHGHYKGRKATPTYNAWRHMKERCSNKNNKDYINYGGRGITFDDRWSKFKNFLEDMGEVPKGLTLERMDNSLGYFKDNCVWTTKKVQACNKRNNVFLTYDGKTLHMEEWGRVTGLGPEVRKRINRGWTTKEALSTPKGTRRKK